jgi:hypothetical protein
MNDELDWYPEGQQPLVPRPEELPPAWLPEGRAWKRANGTWADGYSHKREIGGVCVNCGAGPSEYHYALRPRESPSLR